MARYSQYRAAAGTVKEGWGLTQAYHHAERHDPSTSGKSTRLLKLAIHRVAYWLPRSRLLARNNFRFARQNEAARATDATAWVRSAVVVLIVR